MHLLNEIHQKEFNSLLHDFFNFASDSLVTRNHNYGFRGHSNDAWQLEPTLARFVDRIQAAYHERRNEREHTMKITLRRLRDQLTREYSLSIMICLKNELKRWTCGSTASISDYRPRF